MIQLERERIYTEGDMRRAWILGRAAGFRESAGIARLHALTLDVGESQRLILALAEELRRMEHSPLAHPQQGARLEP